LSLFGLRGGLLHSTIGVINHLVVYLSGNCKVVCKLKPNEILILYSRPADFDAEYFSLLFFLIKKSNKPACRQENQGKSDCSAGFAGPTHKFQTYPLKSDCDLETVSRALLSLYLRECLKTSGVAL
jgi:hypothetical protein